jgi:hypothetical protein
MADLIRYFEPPVLAAEAAGLATGLAVLLAVPFFFLGAVLFLVLFLLVFWVFGAGSLAAANVSGAADIASARIAIKLLFMFFLPRGLVRPPTIPS